MTQRPPQKTSAAGLANRVGIRINDFSPEYGRSWPARGFYARKRSEILRRLEQFRRHGTPLMQINQCEVGIASNRNGPFRREQAKVASWIGSGKFGDPRERSFPLVKSFRDENGIKKR